MAKFINYPLLGILWYYFIDYHWFRKNYWWNQI